MLVATTYLNVCLRVDLHRVDQFDAMGWHMVSALAKLPRSVLPPAIDAFRSGHEHVVIATSYPQNIHPEGWAM